MKQSKVVQKKKNLYLINKQFKIFSKTYKILLKIDLYWLLYFDKFKKVHHTLVLNKFLKNMVRAKILLQKTLDLYIIDHIGI